MVHTCIYFKNITENQENYKNWFSEAEFPFSIPYNLPYLIHMANTLYSSISEEVAHASRNVTNLLPFSTLEGSTM